MPRLAAFPGLPRFHRVCWLTLCSLLASGALGASAPRRFDIPAGQAARTLRAFAAQSGEQLLYPPELIRGLRTRPVKGDRTPKAALEEMLGPDFRVVEDATTGALAIRRASAPEPPPRPEAGANAGGAPGAAINNAWPAADELVELSPFEVRSSTDRGYRAANAVSATRMAVPVRDLPMSISAFTGEFIADQAPYDLYDVVKWAPGVHQDNLSPQGWIRYNIRGFTSAAVQRNGFSSFRFVDTTNVERVEVVRGPASLLYGQLNPGGVINYITKRPQPEPGLQLGASVGSHGYTRALVDATGPVPESNGVLLYRAIAMREDIQEFQDPARGRKTLAAPSLTWRPSEAVTLHLEYEDFTRRERMPTSGVVLAFVDEVPTVPYPGLPWDFNYAGNGDFQNFSSAAFTAELTAQLTQAITLRAAFLHSSWEMEWRATGQGGTGLISQAAIDAYYPRAYGLTPADAMYRRNRYELQSGSEQTLQVDLTGTHRWRNLVIRPLAGARRLFRSRYSGLQKNNPNLPGDPAYLAPWDLRNPATWSRRVPFGPEALVPTSQTRAQNDSSSVYGVVNVSAWDERLHALAGFAHHQLDNEPSIDRIRGTRTPASSRSARVPQLGALYRLTPALSTFVSYSESFLANTSLLRVNNVPTLPASPSRGEGWETGVKLDLREGTLSGTVSAYRIESSPTGVVTVTTGVAPDGTTLFTDLQGGLQRSEGLEFDLHLRPTEALQLITSFSWCDAIYVSHPVNPTFNGTRLVATPEYTFNLWGKYTVQGGALRGLTLAAGLNHVGPMSYVGNNPALEFPAYTTADLNVSYPIRAFGRVWDATLHVKNLANERYHASSSSWGFPRHALLSVSTRL